MKDFLQVSIPLWDNHNALRDSLNFCDPIFSSMTWSDCECKNRNSAALYLRNNETFCSLMDFPYIRMLVLVSRGFSHVTIMNDNVSRALTFLALRDDAPKVVGTSTKERFNIERKVMRKTNGCVSKTTLPWVHSPASFNGRCWKVLLSARSNCTNKNYWLIALPFL